MARKHLVRSRGDVRRFPRYSISEAAFYLHVPASTLKAWTRGQHYTTRFGVHRTFQPLIEPADPLNKLLSFYNLVEAHVLRATRDRDVPLRNVRAALDYIHRTIPGEHPLLTQSFETSGKELFIRHLGKTVNATRQGQLAMRKILQKYLKRVVRDEHGLPMQICPMGSRRLAIHPHICSGKPIVRGRGISASVLWGRKHTGEAISEIARDYGMRQLEVRQAIREYNAA